MAQLDAMRSRRVELRHTAAFAAVGMLLATAFGLSTLITPLYMIYQKAFGFSQITLTLIYAAYAIGNIAALLFFGRASDRAGRRVTALSAIVLLLLAALVFLSPVASPGSTSAASSVALGLALPAAPAMHGSLSSSKGARPS